MSTATSPRRKDSAKAAQAAPAPPSQEALITATARFMACDTIRSTRATESDWIGRLGSALKPPGVDEVITGPTQDALLYVLNDPSKINLEALDFVLMRGANPAHVRGEIDIILAQQTINASENVDATDRRNTISLVRAKLDAVQQSRALSEGRQVEVKSAKGKAPTNDGIAARYLRLGRDRCAANPYDPVGVTILLDANIKARTGHSGFPEHVTLAPDRMSLGTAALAFTTSVAEYLGSTQSAKTFATRDGETCLCDERTDRDGSMVHHQFIATAATSTVLGSGLGLALDIDAQIDIEDDPGSLDIVLYVARSDVLAPIVQRALSEARDSLVSRKIWEIRDAIAALVMAASSSALAETAKAVPYGEHTSHDYAQLLKEMAYVGEQLAVVMGRPRAPDGDSITPAVPRAARMAA